MTSRKELLELFDKNVAAGREALWKVSDEALMKPWALLSGGKKMMEMPRIAVLRGFILSHNVHHRAQLGVYLRLKRRSCSVICRTAPTKMHRAAADIVISRFKEQRAGVHPPT